MGIKDISRLDGKLKLAKGVCDIIICSDCGVHEPICSKCKHTFDIEERFFCDGNEYHLCRKCKKVLSSN